MKATVHFGLKLPIPGQQFSNREVHVTLEEEAPWEQRDDMMKELTAFARKTVNAEMTTFGVPAKQTPVLE
jgi:hypothetical protein